MRHINIYILIAVGIVFLSNSAIAENGIVNGNGIEKIENVNGNGIKEIINGNGILNINITEKVPLLYNIKSAQTRIVRVENNIEKVLWISENKLPFDMSFSVAPGIYKIYIKKDRSTTIEYNNDSTGYVITPGSKINIPRYSVKYRNGLLTDVLSDAPWRINPGEKIPISYIIKDANQLPIFVRTITIWDDDEPIGNGANDTLVYTHGLYKWFTKDLWYDYDSLSPTIFNEQDRDLEIHTMFDIALEFDVHNFYTVHISPYNLPKLNNWYYGDTHYHTNYTDNAYEFGAPIGLTRITGKVIGINWVTTTDHSFDLDPNRWNSLVKESRTYSDNNFRILPSEEISCTVPGGIYQEYNHYLAYNITNFIPGGEWEDGTGSNYNCSQLVSIVNSQKGFGYPAHPMNDGIFTQPWQDYSLNFKGLEIWNGAGNTLELEKGLDKWVELLLKGRKIFVEAGSDAHGDLNSAFGKVRTLTYAATFDDKNILSSLRNGHSIMTDGPLVVFNINGTIIGNTRNAEKGSKIDLNVKWNSTPEFGTVHHIEIIKGIIGNTEIIEKELHPHTYSGTSKITITAMQDVYYRLVAHTSNGSVAYTNPIWINTPPASITGLKNITYKPKYINWIWKDPKDIDFAKVKIYINGLWKKDVSKGIQFYNATGLHPNTLYKISTRTVDIAGNINQTWVNKTGRTVP